MAKPSASLNVPKAMTETFEAIAALTDAFCDEHLDAHYKRLSRLMAAALCRRRPSPLSRGQPRTWAPSIIYYLGQLNFLTDPHTEPFMTTADLAAKSGVGQSTLQAKSRVIDQVMHATRLSVEWLVPSMTANNPLIWMAEINGFIVDLRHMPREVQEIALAKGLIPYLPDDQDGQHPEA